MKSKIVMKKEANPEDRKYPWLGYYCNKDEQDYWRVVLFTSNGCGVVVNAEGSESVLGEYCDCWSEYSFEEFKGQVILSND